MQRGAQIHWVLLLLVWLFSNPSSSTTSLLSLNFSFRQCEIHSAGLLSYFFTFCISQLRDGAKSFVIPDCSHCGGAGSLPAQLVRRAFSSSSAALCCPFPVLDFFHASPRALRMHSWMFSTRLLFFAVPVFEKTMDYAVPKKIYIYNPLHSTLGRSGGWGLCNPLHRAPAADSPPTCVFPTRLGSGEGAQSCCPAPQGWNQGDNKVLLYFLGCSLRLNSTAFIPEEHLCPQG